MFNSSQRSQLLTDIVNCVTLPSMSKLLKYRSGKVAGWAIVFGDTIAIFVHAMGKCVPLCVLSPKGIDAHDDSSEGSRITELCDNLLGQVAIYCIDNCDTGELDHFPDWEGRAYG